jgi:hypothetical protein
MLSGVYGELRSKKDLTEPALLEMSGNATYQTLGRGFRLTGNSMAQLLQLGIFRLGFLQDGDFRVGVFP